LAHGAAHDLPSALAAMKSGGVHSPRASQRVPTIVFHGAEDSTVNARNGAAIAAQAAAGDAESEHLRAEVHAHVAPGGRPYTRTIHADAAGHPVVEHWLLKDAGHAWSGGSASGSFTDPGGPDASEEMIRFFFAQPCDKAAIVLKSSFSSMGFMR
jgi:poly(3-hydroxybutyrate) depolymerase